MCSLQCQMNGGHNKQGSWGKFQKLIERGSKYIGGQSFEDQIAMTIKQQKETQTAHHKA